MRCGAIILLCVMAASAAAPGGSLTCPLEATIYELRLPPENANQLDAAALTLAAASPAEFDKALASVGQAKALYRMDQSVRLSGDRITINNKVPVVMATRLSRTGRRINLVRYQAVGLVLNIAGSSEPDGGISAELGLEMSALTESTANISDQLSARVVRNVVMAYKGMMRPGVPVVIVSADAASLDAEGKAVAHVARIVLGKPELHVHPDPPPTGGPTGPLAATIYEVHLAPEQIERLDAAALTGKAATAAEFEEALADLGQAKVLYRMDQSVRLWGDRVTIRKKVPFVTATRLSETGQPITTVRYQSVGAVLNIAGASEPDGGISAELGLQISALTAGAANIAAHVPARVVRNVVMAYKGMMRPGAPVVIVSADAASLDAEGKAVAYIARIVLGKPTIQPATPSTGSGQAQRGAR